MRLTRLINDVNWTAPKCSKAGLILKLKFIMTSIKIKALTNNLDKIIEMPVIFSYCVKIQDNFK